MKKKPRPNSPPSHPGGGRSAAPSNSKLQPGDVPAAHQPKTSRLLSRPVLLGLLFLGLSVPAAVWLWKWVSASSAPPSVAATALANPAGDMPQSAPIVPPADNVAPPQPGEAEIIAQSQAEEKALLAAVKSQFGNREEALVVLGDYYRIRGNSALAMNYWSQAISLNPRQPGVLFKMGKLAYERDEFDKAIGFWEQALKVNPNLPGTRWRIGNAWLDSGNPQAAINPLEEELRIAPQSVISWNLLGQAWLQLEQYEKARDCFEKAVALQPEYGKAHYGLFTVYTQLQQPEKARVHREIFDQRKQAILKAEQTKSPQDSNLKSQMNGLAQFSMTAALLYKTAGDASKAEALMKRAVQLEPSREFRMILANFYQEQQRWAEAFQGYQQITSADPQNQYAFLNLGAVAGKIGRFDEAEAALQRAIALGPQHPQGYQQLAELYLQANRHLPAARQWAEKAVAIQADAGNWFTLSQACARNGDRPNALAAMEKALQLEPSQPRYQQFYEQLKSQKN